MNFLFSKINALIIQTQRGVDQTWRQLTGLPMPFRSKITPNLFLGGQYNLRGIHTLKTWGVTAVVNMRTTSSFEKEFKENGFRYLNLPTPDREAPTMEHLLKGIEFIKEEIKNKGKVYIHCKFGEGRGPTMIISYLMSEGLTYEDAFKQVQKVRTFINPTLPQVKRLKELESVLKNNQPILSK